MLCFKSEFNSLCRSSSGILCKWCYPVNQIVVVQVHQNGNRLAKNYACPDKHIAYLALRVRERGQDYEGDLEGGGGGAVHTMKHPRIKNRQLRQGSLQARCLTCAIIPTKAQGRSIRRGILTKYCRGKVSSS